MTEQTYTFARLTPEQRKQWDEEGYLVIRNALSEKEVDELTAAVDRLNTEAQRQGHDSNRVLGVRTLVEKDDAFLNLIDHPNHLGIVLDIMGANIQLSESLLFVRPPSQSPAASWHQDGPSPYLYPRVGGIMPLLQLRVGWFLTDVDRPDMGNFALAPGSHIHGFPKGAPDALKVTSRTKYREVADIVSAVPGAIQLVLKAGDAFLMHNALWHAVARNTSDIARKNLYYMYVPIWARIGDYKEPSPSLLAKCDPVRRQLLGGWAAPDSKFFAGMAPDDEWTPLIHLFHQKSARDLYDERLEQEIRESQS